ncbi:unnamed protein product [Caenorhabditis bovis]|uniref:Sema domain-containing protein n=1 Tax=Caenorhabditis bovis TaxID=2654633 RepID=A0A8S1EK20_9PELO|nr:unnamed protein product [Caenorhabditis bovis]
MVTVAYWCPLLTFCTILVLAASVEASPPPQKHQIFHTTAQIDDFIVSRDGHTIILATVNQLQTIGCENFAVSHNLTIGPIDDSPWCSVDGKSCLREYRPQKTDVHTKILHQLQNGQILHCGSVQLGSCSIYTSKLSLISKSSVPVAANAKEASTVSIVTGNRLIVGASPTRDSPYRDPFPSVAMRTLPNLMIENAGNLDGEAAVFQRTSYRSSFKYIYSFTHEHFVFLVATMTSKDSRATPTTRLIRFCRNDTKFVSYSEIELQCRGEDNSLFPYLSAVVKSDEKLVTAYSSSPNSRKTSICVYSMQRIKLTFWYNVDRCRSGTDSIRLPHIGRDAKCVNKAHIPLDEDSCELGVGGSIELVEMASREIIGNVISFLAIDRKALKWDDDRLEEYGRKDIGDGNTGSEVLRMKRNGDFVIAQFPFGLVREELSTCSQHSSCSECLVSADPLCQWCHPVQACTTSSKCAVPSTVCPVTNGEPVPSSISVNQSVPIAFNIRHLPPPNGFNYQCQFGATNARTKADWTSTGVSCISVPISSPKQFEISLITTLSKNPIISHNITVYDCGQSKTCSQCVSSEWKCEWCIGLNKCVSQNSCKTQKMKSCVRLLPMKVPIAMGSEQEIVIEAENLRQLDRNSQHFCSINVTGKVISAKAKIASDSIRCEKMQLFTENQHNSANLVVPITLSSNDHIVDIANISLYSCASLASDCSSCLALPPSLACGWCSGKCSHECHNSRVTVCDPPRILNFEPNSGPVEGGTIVRIDGTDLGMSEEDVRGKIYVAGSRCELMRYKVSSMIECKVDKGISSGPVKVSVGRVTMTVAESATYYSFVKISVFSAYPLFGPISGGTKITLYGQHLNAGTNASVTIGGQPCIITKANSSSSISCITPAGAVIGKTANVVVAVDQAIVTLDQKFEYRPDPIIQSVSPLSTFKSGGKMISVQGQYFDSILSAQMLLISSANPPFEIISDFSPCHIYNSTLMSCLTPKVIETSNRRFEYSRLPVGFVMDNVTSVLNLGRRIMMSVYPNPQLIPFNGIRLHQGEQPLILDGHNLNLAAEPSDYKIFIGSERCYVTLVDVKQLVCSGPAKQPKATDERGVSIHGFLPLVTVIVGSIRTELGLIEYADQTFTSKFSFLIMSLLVTIIVFLAIIGTIWKRRRQEREREYRKIQLQMESLENNVRKECKQAFAELQTNLVMSPKAKNSTPEFLQFPHFVENLLWSDSTLTVAPTLTRTLPVTLAQFHALLSFKAFIFTIVEAAESDTSMSASEKSMLASLLITVLLRNFSYCTEIVIDLLRAHIAKAVHAKRSELLFRNSDSVVEKMVAKWISMCLYPHITSQMNTFFYLYKALQYQTEKGPVDAVTGDARYTINESRLLRESVETNSLTICVIPIDGSDQIIDVEIHECDAICQLKQKILSAAYRETPYSQRPKINQIDLVLKCPRRGDVKLSDLPESNTIHPRKSPIKLQTVADYEITNGSIIQVTQAMYLKSNYRNSLADSGQSSWSSLDRCSPTYSSSKYYHLSNPSSGTMSFKKQKYNDNVPRSIPEVYLTRLLTSKGTVQSYVEDFLESVLYMHEVEFPPVLKHFFDLLDREAAVNAVSENICQQWKANSYVLRVWANFVRNPQLIFDEPYSISMDANLSTVAQTLMDCFSFSEPVLGAHSPSSRLLFAKDVARLRPLSVDLFRRVKNSPPLSMDQWQNELVNMSNDVSSCKGSSLALSELLSWVRGNGIRITQLLASNEQNCEQRLAQKLSQVLNVSLDTDNHIYSTISDYD